MAMVPLKGDSERDEGLDITSTADDLYDDVQTRYCGRFGRW